MSANLEKLVAAARELNDVLGLAPEIELTAAISVIEDKLREAAELVDSDEDELTDATLDVLKSFGLGNEVDAPDSKEDAASDDTQQSPTTVDVEKEQDMKEEAKQEEKEEDKGMMFEAVDLVGLITTTSKLKDLKEIVKHYPQFNSIDTSEFSGLSGPKLLKTEMLAVLEVGKGGGEGVSTSKSKVVGLSKLHKINILASENPKRKNSASFDRFALYKNGITVDAYVSAGGRRIDIGWDVKRNFISLYRDDK